MNTTLTTLVLSFALLTPGDDPTPKFPLGKDTTYVDGPLDKEGYIDYAATLNEMLAKGIKPENNANVALWRALGPEPEHGVKMPREYFKLLGMDEPPKSGDYFVGLRNFLKDHLKITPPDYDGLAEMRRTPGRRPWKEEDFPRIAAWIVVNEKPLAMVIEATRLPDYFNPINSKSIIGTLLPSAQSCRDVAGALAARAMMRVANGESDAAWQDLLACHRLGRLIGRGPTLIEALVSITIDQIATDGDLAYVAFAKLNASQIHDRLQDLEKLPPLPSIADKVDLAGRLSLLELLQYTRKFGTGYLKGLSGGEMKKASEDELKRLASIDWAPGLRSANRWISRIVAVMRMKNRSEREAEFAKFDEEYKALREKVLAPENLLKLLLLTDANDKAAPGQEISDMLVGLLMPAARKVIVSQERGEQVQRNLRVAFALAAFHSDNARYPAKLAELAPKYLAAVPDDLFSGKPLVYQPTKAGYLLYSVGPNGKDDAGRGRDDDPPGDDLAMQMPLPALNSKKK